MNGLRKHVSKKNISRAGFVVFTVGIIMFAAVAIAKPKPEKQYLATAIGLSGIFAILIGAAAWTSNLKNPQDRAAERHFLRKADEAHLERSFKLPSSKSKEK